jgi:hypothetical protein
MHRTRAGACHHGKGLGHNGTKPCRILKRMRPQRNAAHQACLIGQFMQMPVSLAECRCGIDARNHQHRNAVGARLRHRGDAHWSRRVR